MRILFKDFLECKGGIDLIGKGNGELELRRGNRLYDCFMKFDILMGN